jgi:hypothetical protein
MACVSSYTSALGYRARQAVLRGDVQAFDELMEEAADTLPRHPYDNPKRTVLTHFLDFGGSDLFFPMIEKWRAKDWISDNMTCAIHRARYRGVVDKDPDEALRAADVCLDRARIAAGDPDRRWEIDACLEEAPFLTYTSTTAIARYIAMTGDQAEPYLFRAGLLEGMTTMFLQDPGIRRANDPTVAKEKAYADSLEQLNTIEKRFDAILKEARRTSEQTLVAGATAVGALEIERVSIVHGRSYFGRILASGTPDDGDLVWGWVRAVKSRKRMGRLEPMGLYDRRREPEGDAYWYLCTSAPERVSEKTAKLTAVSVMAREEAQDKEALRASSCDEKAAGMPLPNIHGPFPIEVTARAAVTASVAASLGEGATVQLDLKRRISVPKGVHKSAMLD